MAASKTDDMQSKAELSLRGHHKMQCQCIVLILHTHHARATQRKVPKPQGTAKGSLQAPLQGCSLRLISYGYQLISYGSVSYFRQEVGPKAPWARVLF